MKTVTHEMIAEAIRLTANQLAGGEPMAEPVEEVVTPWFESVKVGRATKGKVSLSDILQDNVTPNFKFDRYECPPDLQKYVPKIDYNFIPDAEYALALLQAISMNETLTAYGPPGSGKTETVSQICAWLNRPYVFLSGMGGTDPSDYIGMNTLEDGNMVWCAGDLSHAVEHGLVCLFDEPFKCTPATLMCIQSLIDDRRTLKLYGQTDRDKATMKAHPEFRLILADNVRGVGDQMHRYSAEIQDQSTLNRSMFKVQVGYPNPDVEAAILLRKNPTANPDFLTSVVKLANLIRSGWEDDQFALPYSLRDSNNFVRLAMIEGKASTAFKKTYYNAASDEERMALKKLWDTVSFNKERLQG